MKTQMIKWCTGQYMFTEQFKTEMREKLRNQGYTHIQFRKRGQEYDSRYGCVVPYGVIYVNRDN